MPLFNNWWYFPPDASNAFTETSSGGIVLGGSATTVVARTYTASGGIVLGGSGVAQLAHFFTSSGGIVLGGGATAQLHRTATSSGGIVLGGSATATAGIIVDAVGGIVLGGSHTATAEYNFTSSGGIVLGGSAAPSATFETTSSGGIVLGGSATSSATFETTSSGGIVLGGDSSAVVGGVATASGGIVLGGSAAVFADYNVTAAGGIVLGGSAATSGSFTVASIGGIVLGGSATSSAAFETTSSGGIVLGGDATPVRGFNATAAGGIVLGGSATSSATFETTSSGGIVLGGDSTPFLPINVRSSGGIVLGGSASYSVDYEATSTGGIVLGGSAYVSLSYVADSSGGIVLGGTATVSFNENDSGRQGMHVDQGEGESEWPLVAGPSEDIKYLLSDAYLAYEDDDFTAFVPGFRIKWIYGFGTEAATVCGSGYTPVHAQDAIIVDSEDTVVIDTRDATYFHSSAWGDLYRIHEWRTPTAVLRLVKHLYWPPATVEPQYREYSNSFCPDNAVLASRVTERVSKRLRSIRVGSEVLQGNIRVLTGFSTQLVTGEGVTEVGSVRKRTEVELSAAAGSGAGRFSNCDDAETTPIRTFNGVAPDSQGRFTLQMPDFDCHRVIQPLELVSTTPRRYAVTPNTLQLVDYCEARCPPTAFVNTYKAMRRVHGRYATLGVDVVKANKLYDESVARWNQAQFLRSRGSYTIDANITQNRYVAVGGAFCNVAGVCLGELELKFRFDFVKRSGNVDTIDEDVEYTVSVVPCKTFATDLCTRKMLREDLSGSYPELSMFWDSVPASSQLRTYYLLDYDVTTPGRHLLRIILSAYINGNFVPWGLYPQDDETKGARLYQPMESPC